MSDRGEETQANTMTTLANTQKTRASLEALRRVNERIPERKFHEFTYILHDLRTLLGMEEKTYLEIGSYVGSSASLMLSHDFKTNVICVDPCVLDRGHYGGALTQPETLRKNLRANNPHGRRVEVHESFSHDQGLLQKLSDAGTTIDILFIDGGHATEEVLNDWNNFKDFVNPGGFICFDDYYDDIYSPGVRPAVDRIVQEIDEESYEVIGSPENVLGLSRDDPDYKHPDFINEFIIRKREQRSRPGP
jgi:predicted O-methyltransferase YrrM